MICHSKQLQGDFFFQSFLYSYNPEHLISQANSRILSGRGGAIKMK